jgi:hypothetical protein
VYEGYRRVSFSRKGVEGLQRVFPDDMGFDSRTIRSIFAIAQN